MVYRIFITVLQNVKMYGFSICMHPKDALWQVCLPSDSGEEEEKN